MKKLVNRLKKDKKPIIVGLISIAAVIFGSLAIGFLPAFLIVLFLDIIFIILSKPKKKKKFSFSELLKTLFIVGFCCTIMVLILGICFGGYIVLNAPEFTQEKLYNKDATVIYDRDGNEMTKLGTEIRQKVTYDELSQSLIDAIIATEDSRYFQHSGVDLPRFLKASISQVLGAGGGGASTITMQVSKTTFTSTEDEGLAGIIRKFSDIYISVFKIETHYTKEEIIEFYVNSNNLGGTNRGVEQASLNYFGKSASELNVAEAALIAGLFQAPNSYRPDLYPEACEKRRQTVLSLMLRHGYITQEEYNIAKELTVDKLLVDNKEENDSSEYQDFIDTVVEEVYDRTGLDPYVVPMKIYTTMDKDMQNNMNGVMDGTLYEWKNDVVQGASIVLDVNTGDIVAVGGGRNRVVRGDNYAINLNRQIGSTAKPLYDYGPGIEYNNWSTYTTFADEPYTYSDGTKIKNWDNKYSGVNTLHNALKHSRNIPAIKAFQQINNKKINNFVTNLGLNPTVTNGQILEAHSIGGYNGESPLTIAAAYAAFSNGGYYIEPHSFTKIEFIESGENYEVKPITRKAMSSETAYMITKVLEDTSSYAVGVDINGVNYAAKTGTTNLDSSTIEELNLPNNAIRDKWIASFNDSYSIAVWYGYKANSSEHYLTTSDYSIKKLFQSIAKSVYTKKSTWDMPNNVIKVKVEAGLPTAMLPSEFTPEKEIVTAYFKKGFEPTETSTRYLKLDNVSNLNYDESTNTLSWIGINTPELIDETYLTNLYSPLYTDVEARDEYVAEILKNNEENIGTLTYDIYTKDEEGNLTLIGTTDSTDYPIEVTETTTFVVKSSYTIFKDNASDGAEFTITKIETPVITAEINGDTNIIINIGDTYTEPVNPVIVLENGITDITAQSTITYEIKRYSDNTYLDDIASIDTNFEETYEITYTIIYNNIYKTTLTKIVQVSNLNNLE